MIKTRLGSKEINSIVTSLYAILKYSDSPQPDDVVVYHDSIKVFDEEEDLCEAVAKVTVNYCGPRVHKVHMQFQVNSDYKVIGKTLTYL